ncbi:MAG: putative membrane protein SirB2 [Cocleimonas sp.]|jgi:uncharacterized membrane protein SirB2
MDPYVLAKAHSGIAILVAVFYILRGGLMLASSAKLRSVVLTAINHTLVLVMVLLGLYTAHLKGIPFSNSFVITKLICLTAFVILGGVALKQGLTKPVASLLWLLGLVALAYAWMLGKQIAPAFF